MSTTALAELDPGGIWITERPVWFQGVKLRSRMTVVKLSDGKLWIHSAGEPTAELCAELDRLGEVGWVVVPNRYHHIHAPAMKARYPGARVIGPASAKLRNEELGIDVAIDDAKLASLIPDMTGVALRGVPFLDETLFFHTKTRTLIGTDVMMCGCAKDHWTWRWASRVWRQYERYKVPPDVWWNTRHGGPLVRESIDELAKLPVERILVAHSDPITERPIAQLEDAWRFARK
jgi:hypothetical protein